MSTSDTPPQAFPQANLLNIQGLGIAGFNKDFQESVFIQLNSQEGGQALLAWLQPQVANAWEVATFNSLFSEIKARNGSEPLAATWMAVGISATGYDALGVSLADLPAGDSATAFQAGMPARATEIGDVLPGDEPSGWLTPFQSSAPGIHMVVVVAADEECDLDAQLVLLYEQVSSTGCTVVFAERGGTLSPPLTGHEHFGFKDGISQPAILGYGAQPAPGEPPAVAAGEFVIGYPDQTGAVATCGPNWEDGSFLVFRRLTQHVMAFREQAAAGVPNSNPSVAEPQLAADMIGRWPSGAPLELFPESDPGPGNAVNDFAYLANDASGEICPIWAHIRKAHPRDEETPGGTQPGQADDPTRHRMFRRGIPFGPPLPAAATADDGVPRGLHFYSVVSDLVRQFEFIQNNWINNPDFPVGTVPPTPGSLYQPPTTGTLAGGPDPVVSEHDATAQCVLQQASGASPFSVPMELVNVTAGAYFFLPSLSALANISGLSGSTGD